MRFRKREYVMEYPTDDVHYRLYVPRSGIIPAVVCMQENDYFDYDGTRFLNDVRYKTEEDAQAELDRLYRLLFGGW